MEKKTADNLSYSSKFDRSRAFMDELRKEGRDVRRTSSRCRHKGKADCEDAAY